MNKEIQKIKIALTSSCTLNCTHCNIDKKSNLTINFKQAKKAVDLLLSSKGKYKRLELYGGEPFLRFNLLKEISSYAFKKAKTKNKKLSLHIASNGTIVNPDILKWLKESNVHLAISFSGTKNSHNFNRKFPDEKGSRDIVLRNIKKIISTIKNNRLIIIYCVDPFFVKNMLKDFKEILSTKVKIIDIECVHGVKWTEEDFKIFSENFSKINSQILKLAKKNKFIFHEAFIEYIRLNGFSVPNCPFYMDFEVYPDGGIGFYPYAFMNYKKDKEIVTIGNIDEKIDKRYLNCKYPSKNCLNCIKDYYRLKGLYEGDFAYQIRNNKIEENFKQIISLSKDKNIKKYFKELIKLKKSFYGE